MYCFPKVFEGVGKFKGEKVTLAIDPEVIPVAQPVRRLPYHYSGKVKSRLDELESQGIIEKVESATTWASPIQI